MGNILPGLQASLPLVEEAAINMATRLTELFSTDRSLATPSWTESISFGSWASGTLFNIQPDFTYELLMG